MPRVLNTHHLERLAEYGYLIIPEYYAGPQLKEMQAAQRRTLPIWEKVKDNPPANRAILTEFPPAEMVLPHGIVDHHAWDFSRKWLRTNQIHFQAGCMIARYPGFKDGVWVVILMKDLAVLCGYIIRELKELEYMEHTVELHI